MDATQNDPQRSGLKRSFWRWLLLAAGSALLAAGLATALMWQQGWALKMGFRFHGADGPVRTVWLPADGRMHPAMRLEQPGFGRRSWSRVGINHNEIAKIMPTEGDSGRFALLMVTSPVTPQRITLHILQPSFLHTRNHTIRLEFEPSDADSFGDGTPDFLRLHITEDRKAFRDWFTLMANLLYDKQDVDADSQDLPAGVQDLPRGVQDCAGLLRYAYREALLQHDGRWFTDERTAGRLAVMPPIGDLRQYHYPNTPMGAGLFRVQPGKFSLDDLKDGAFAQFADARTLMEQNTHLISRDIHMALPGDVIFYRQLGQNSPYHSMIIVNDGGDQAVVYDTGPTGKAKGEIRRMTMRDLLDHPDARWRPVAGNPNFLGVYRWNILRED